MSHGRSAAEVGQWSALFSPDLRVRFLAAMAGEL